MQPARNRLSGDYGAHLYEYPPRIRHDERLSAGRLVRPSWSNLNSLPRKFCRAWLLDQPPAGGAGSLGTGCRAARKL